MFNLNFFKKSGPGVVGIDIGSSAIKIVELEKKEGRAYLTTYGALALGHYAGTQIGRATSLPPEKIAEALLDLFREAKATSKRAGLAIPVSSTLMSLIELPAVDEKELKTMIPLEARKYIPVPISEVTLDWFLVPKDEFNPQMQDKIAAVDNKQKIFPRQEVLVVAIHNEAIAKYQDIVRKTELDASFFEVELFSTMRSITDQELKPVMVIDIGAALTKLYIVERGVMRFSHTINRGSQDITLAISKSLDIPVDQAEIIKRQRGLMKKKDGPEISEIILLVLDYIFSEAAKALSVFQTKHSKLISKVFLVGGGSALPGLIDFAGARFQTDVFLGDPFAKVNTPAFLAGILKNTGPEFAVSVGVALRRLQEI